MGAKRLLTWQMLGLLCPCSGRLSEIFKFQFYGTFYKYTVFPNGLDCCPRIFTKLLKPVYSTLRQQQHESASYIYDAYLNGPSYDQCQTNIINSVCLFETLGFIIHPEKSVLTPVQEIGFLGFILNSKI